MQKLFSSLVFLHPWVLAALALLPVLWYILRVTPPAPQVIALPTARFLEGLIPVAQTPSRTPWWILLLRLLLAVLLIAALARPVLQHGAALPGQGPLRLIIDNSWPGAQSWAQQQRAALDLLGHAERAGRAVTVLTTAPIDAGGIPPHSDAMTAAQAMAWVKGLQPLPWPARYDGMMGMLNEIALGAPAQSVWLSHGIDESASHSIGLGDVLRLLQNQGGVEVFYPPPESLPLVLKKPQGQNIMTPAVALDAPAALPAGRPVTVLAQDEAGRTLAQETLTLDPAAAPVNVAFELQGQTQGALARFALAGMESAAGSYILDERFDKKTVGLVTAQDESAVKPFVEAAYYLTRALSPYTALLQDDINALLEQNPSVIIFADHGALPAATLEDLETWIERGGLLLRFAGPTMAAVDEAAFLTPVKLRTGERAMDGSVTWQTPLALAPFPETSPLFGLLLSTPVSVRQQILAQPAADLAEKTWARLEDGTPLITAAPLGKGWRVMVHTTATPDWSDLPLSGLYVEILRRVIALAGAPRMEAASKDGMLQPLWLLDGFGRRQKPEGRVQAIAADAFDTVQPGPLHPPGLYGRAGFEKALNLGDRLAQPVALTALPAGVQGAMYGQSYSRDLTPMLLTLAFALFLLDWLLMMAMMFGLRFRRSVLMLTLALLMPAAADAATPPPASGFYLAYIQTGDAAVDAASRAGLENLRRALTERTSAEPEGVIALNPMAEDLAFYPLIYWPVTAKQAPLSGGALRNIQFYLDHGGTILFDTRGAQDAQLRLMTGGLNIPALEPISKDHVLGRTFYLLHSFPGRHDGGTFWVESNSLSGRDGVSSVMIGSHDWAAAWAAKHPARQQEMALRFGVNLVLYALTGNYKADQVHVPFILERLGQ